MKISVTLYLMGLTWLSGGSVIVSGNLTQQPFNTKVLLEQHNSVLRSRRSEESEPEGIDWCNLSCGKTPNIACTFHGDCLNIDEPCQLLLVDHVRLLDIHNELRWLILTVDCSFLMILSNVVRNLFATGNEPRTEGLQVADMMALQWDDNLAFTASCNLKSSKCTPDVKSDDCHITPTFTTSSQNIAWAAGVPDCLKETLKMVQTW